MKATTSVKERLSSLESIRCIIEWMAANKEGTRTGLAKAMCERLDLRDGKGALQMASTAKALRDLERAGHFRLPAGLVQGVGRWTARQLEDVVPLPEGVPSRAEQVEGLELIEVRSEQDELFRTWNTLMQREHPLHDCRLVGRQLRYLISSPYGWLGGIGFGSSALYLHSRDQWIGWNEAQRAQHQQRVINLTRYLIRGSVQCENLASHVLGLCARRVAGDYHARYGIEPWLLETFVNREQYAGTCFQAANWIGVGQTTGRGRNGGKHEGKSIKDVYLYPLRADFRARMGVNAAVVQPLNVEDGLDTEAWAQQEFGGCDLGDPRRTAQLVNVARHKGRLPGGSYARACGGNRHQVKCYYRMMNTKRDEMSSEAWLQGHREQTIRRLASEKVVLIVQDTMDLNFSTRQHCENLGQIGTNQMGAKSKGLKMHSALALNTRGIPLGVLRVQSWAPEAAVSDTHRNDLPIEKKDSWRWVQTYRDAVAVASSLEKTHLVVVGDRESDIYELFDERRKQGGRVDLLVRVQHNRCLQGEDTKLFETIGEGPAAATVSISVPRQREKPGKPSQPGQPAMPARMAQVEVRFRDVTICAPHTARLKHKPALRLFAISLLERHPPSGASAIRWILLTTLEVRSLKQALKCVRWYCRRWRIEEWHRVLKSGCRILEHQNHTAEVLMRTIVIDAVIAWRIMALTLLGRQMPELPASLLFNDWECQTLQLLAQKKKPVTLGEAIVLIARLGGYLNRKCDGPPGFQSLWRGYARFKDMAYTLSLKKVAQ